MVLIMAIEWQAHTVVQSADLLSSLSVGGLPSVTNRVLAPL